MSTQQRKRHLTVIPPVILVPNPGRRCGWPEKECKEPDSAHQIVPGHRLPWGGHAIQCQIVNPDPGPDLDGYMLCCMATEHGGQCCYRRHAAEGFLDPKDRTS